MKEAEKDPRIGPTHIGLYAVLVGRWANLPAPGPLKVFARDVSSRAKMGCSTYYRLVRELAVGGYLKYEPSYDPKRPSRIYFRSDY
ncbi:hypothetical protein GCM10027275_42980 [Rhabdobacter roseus]|uniref:Transcriptional regulator n=1 Tax=Rhabdobacter roseus TaxID=1655419 RepID=A0A840U2S2_9BACT|nr:hypothetical protein [Rhabdobacter roseus]MBB5286648.1 hypothetical protein [Rhabdobacter roseus]